MARTKIAVLLMSMLVGCYSHEEFISEYELKYRDCKAEDLCVVIANPCSCMDLFVNYSYAAEVMELADEVWCGFNLFPDEASCIRTKHPACIDGRCENADCNSDQPCGWPRYPDDFECPTDEDPERLCDTPNPPDPW